VKWLLDTNVISESVRPRANPKVLAWIAARADEDLAISILTLAELRDGVAALGDENRRRRFEGWMSGYVIPNFEERTLPLTLEILVDWLQLSRLLQARGKPHATADLLIAATARNHNLTLVTRNLRDFTGTGVVVYDPWNDKTHAMDAP
jgi:toxin FitB